MLQKILLSLFFIGVLCSVTINTHALEKNYASNSQYMTSVDNYKGLILAKYDSVFKKLSEASIEKILTKIIPLREKYITSSTIDETNQLKILSLLDALEIVLQTYITDTGETAKPHVILFMSDDQGFGQVGYNGHPDLKTPNFDAMAKEGVQLNYFYSIAPICSPTRISVMTGLHPYKDKCLTVGNCVLQKATTTLPEILQEHGYTTGHFGKWHIGRPKGPKASWPTDNGFSESYSHIMFFDIGENTFYENGKKQDITLTEDTSDFLVEKALNFIKLNKDTPTFTVIWLPSPHTPYIALDSDKALYPNFSGNTQAMYGEISALDRSLGTLRKGLSDLGIKDNTLLWYNSDNGGLTKDDSFANGKLKGAKNSLHEGGIRVPGIIEYPKKFTAKKIDTPISTLDIMPTVLELAGIDIPQNLDGKSVISSLEGNSQPHPIYFWYDKDVDSVSSILDAEAIIIEFPYKLHRESKTQYSLYNIETDPNETTNIYNQSETIAQSMKIKLENWQKSVLEDIKK